MEEKNPIKSVVISNPSSPVLGAKKDYQDTKPTINLP